MDRTDGGFSDRDVWSGYWIGVNKSMCRKKVSSVSCSPYRVQRKCAEDGVTMRLGWYVPLQDCTPLLPRCKTVSWGLKCQPLMLNIGDVTTITCVISTSAHHIIGPPYIHTHCTSMQCAKGIGGLDLKDYL